MSPDSWIMCVNIHHVYAAFLPINQYILVSLLRKPAFALPSRLLTKQVLPDPKCPTIWKTVLFCSRRSIYSLHKIITLFIDSSSMLQLADVAELVQTRCEVRVFIFLMMPIPESRTKAFKLIFLNVSFRGKNSLAVSFSYTVKNWGRCWDSIIVPFGQLISSSTSSWYR